MGGGESFEWCRLDIEMKKDAFLWNLFSTHLPLLQRWKVCTTAVLTLQRLATYFFPKKRKREKRKPTRNLWLASFSWEGERDEGNFWQVENGKQCVWMMLAIFFPPLLLFRQAWREGKKLFCWHKIEWRNSSFYKVLFAFSASYFLGQHSLNHLRIPRKRRERIIQRKKGRSLRKLRKHGWKGTHPGWLVGWVFSLARNENHKEKRISFWEVYYQRLLPFGKSGGVRRFIRFPRPVFGGGRKRGKVIGLWYKLHSTCWGVRISPISKVLFPYQVIWNTIKLKTLRERRKLSLFGRFVFGHSLRIKNLWKSHFLFNF